MRNQLSQLRKKKATMSIYLAGHANCLTNEDGHILTVHIRPLSLKVLMEHPETQGVIQMLDTLSKQEKEQVEAKATIQVKQMNATEQFKMIQKVIDAGKMILSNYAFEAGWVNLSKQTENKNIVDIKKRYQPEFYPVKFLDDTIDVVEGLNTTEEATADADETYTPTFYISLQSISDEELVESVEVIKNIMQNMQTSNQSTIEIETTKGGKEREFVSPDAINQFPTNL